MRHEITSYGAVTSLLVEAQQYSVGSVDVVTLLEARDLCEPYLDMTNVTEHSSQVHTTLSVILKWVSTSTIYIYYKLPTI